jgi:hypothetical protein
LPRITTLATTLTAVALLAGCGDEDEDAGTTTTTTRDTTAASPPGGGPVAEIAAVRRLLDEAVAKYEDGDAKAAERLVGDAYLEHFEEVEHPLEERDAELMESLEKTISTTIRERIKSGAPVGEVAALVEQAKRQLAGAEELLK